MVMWVFGYGSLIWNAGFEYEQRLVGFVRGYRRVFHQGSTDHRGTPAFPGRTVTLEPHPDPAHICWGVAYKVSGHDAEQIAFSDEDATEPTVKNVLVYIASTNKDVNINYLGPAPLETMAHQIIEARGPSGPNIDYLFKLETVLIEMGCKDEHVTDVANTVRKALTERDENGTLKENGVK